MNREGHPCWDVLTEEALLDHAKNRLLLYINLYPRWLPSACEFWKNFPQRNLLLADTPGTSRGCKRALAGQLKENWDSRCHESSLQLWCVVQCDCTKAVTSPGPNSGTTITDPSGSPPYY